MQPEAKFKDIFGGRQVVMTNGTDPAVVYDNPGACKPETIKTGTLASVVAYVKKNLASS